jgi:hypothetical protein
MGAMTELRIDRYGSILPVILRRMTPEDSAVGVAA